MSERPTRRAPPGWYSEEGQPGYRFWDGQSWADPKGHPAALYGAPTGKWNPSEWRQAGMALLGAAVALLVAGMTSPWAYTETGRRGLLDSDLPWQLSPGGLADTWVLLPASATLVWALVVIVLDLPIPGLWFTIMALGLAVMFFCVTEALALDDGLEASGGEVGSGVFMAFAGGATAAVSGALFSARS